MPFFGVPIRNGLPIGLGSVAGFGVQQFDPSLLFEGGTVPGAWYDPSDLSTMFTTDAGTTPVAMPGGGTAVSVGRILDKSGNGNHAVSIAPGSSTSRPELRARVNLLTYSEEFDNGAWVKVGGAVSANSTPAPDGTITADTFTASATFLRHGVLNTGAPASLPANTPVVFSAYVKKGNYNFVSLLVTNNITTWFRATFDFSGASPVLSQSANGAGGTYISASVEAAANGFWRLVVRGSTTDTTLFGEICLNSSATPPSQNYGEEIWTAAGTETVIVWGADLRPANIGANVPAYQRIADANTYDTNGFPLYLLFDGIDDGMYTPANLNLSATDKVGVFAGVRKLSDAAAAIISEFSASAGFNNGTFYFAGPTASGAADFVFASRGTTIRIPTATGLSAPLTRVLSGIGDISGDIAQLRVNGVVAATETGDQGTGNYGTYPLYIGSRNNSTFWFQGQVYGLVIVGGAVSAGNISATESWMAQKTGIVIP